MSYSSIKRKHCICEDCKNNPEKAKWPTFGCFSYFYAHLPEDLKEKTGTKKAVAIRNRNKTVALGRKLHAAQNKANPDSHKLELFFASAAVELRNKPICSNCGAFIPEKFFRAATAHVLPKRANFGFPSIANHPENRIYLGAGCGCHNQYDSSWDNARKMSIWPKAVEKFKILYPFIAPEELKNIPDILLKTLIN